MFKNLCEITEKHYDKILHVTITFVLLSFLRLALEVWVCFVGVLILQIFKHILNTTINEDHPPVGDWIANTIGFGLYALYLILGG